MWPAADTLERESASHSPLPSCLATSGESVAGLLRLFGASARNRAEASHIGVRCSHTFVRAVQR
jgi:hypothetical protein